MKLLLYYSFEILISEFRCARKAAFYDETYFVPLLL